VATVVSSALVIWFAAALAGFAPDPTLKIPGITKLATRAATRGDVSSRFVFGMANGLLPCGLVYATLGIAVASGEALTGALAMTAFGLGTTPTLAVVALSVRRLTADRLWMRRVVALLVLIMGLMVVFQRHGRDPSMGHGMNNGTADDSAPAMEHTPPPAP
jgi:sulfite exporter TauE/SafE